MWRLGLKVFVLVCAILFVATPFVMAQEQQPPPDWDPTHPPPDLDPTQPPPGWPADWPWPPPEDWVPPMPENPPPGWPADWPWPPPEDWIPPMEEPVEMSQPGE